MGISNSVDPNFNINHNCLTIYRVWAYSSKTSIYFQLNFKFIIFGRVLLTLSYGSLGLAVGPIMKKYFGPDNKFTFFNALVGACSILGCLLNSLLASNLTNIYGVLKASIIPLLLALICTLCLIILTIIDKKYYSATEET